MSKDTGILRCRGRFDYSGLFLNTRQPILLTKNHDFTELIVREAYATVIHAEVNATLAEIKRTFWITKSKKSC